jgi:5-methylcytosine-specific restriction enzyme subunit McrC
MNTINLIEYKPLYIPRDEIPKDIINQLKQQYQTQFKITLEDTTKGDQWKLISQGWVGYIPLTSDWSIHITRKVPITNLLGFLTV